MELDGDYFERRAAEERARAAAAQDDAARDAHARMAIAYEERFAQVSAMASAADPAGDQRHGRSEAGP